MQSFVETQRIIETLSTQRDIGEKFNKNRIDAARDRGVFFVVKGQFSYVLKLVGSCMERMCGFLIVSVYLVKIMCGILRPSIWAIKACLHILSDMPNII